MVLPHCSCVEHQSIATSNQRSFMFHICACFLTVLRLAIGHFWVENLTWTCYCPIILLQPPWSPFPRLRPTAPEYACMRTPNSLYTVGGDAASVVIVWVEILKIFRLDWIDIGHFNQIPSQTLPTTSEHAVGLLVSRNRSRLKNWHTPSPSTNDVRLHVIHIQGGVHWSLLASRIPLDWEWQTPKVRQ